MGNGPHGNKLFKIQLTSPENTKIMSKFSYLPLVAAKKLYSKLIGQSIETGRNWKMFSDKAYANGLIQHYLNNSEPCMIARFGSTELINMVNYLGVKNGEKNYWGYIKGEALSWWWNKNVVNQLGQWSGVFPAREDIAAKFCELMLDDIQQIDVLASWLLEERYFADKLIRAKRVVLEDLEPFFAPNPWTKALEGKKVLVVHPFESTIQSQYKKRNLLFENNFLPEFDLKTLKAVQSIAGEPTSFANWFDALEWMKLEMDKIDYEIAIIGAGAYGLPLAAHAKRSGKKAIHLAGITQMLFGIKGARWEEFIVWPYMNLFNEHWIRPGQNERPAGAQSVEGACYW